MNHCIDLTTAGAWLAAQQELALLDVREKGQFGEGHLFASVPLPYSRLELDVRRLVPNRSVRVVLCDNGDGIAQRSLLRLAGLGYANLGVLEGGPAEWRKARIPLFEGVHTVSKTFGELVDHAYGTPQVSPLELHARMRQGDDVVVVDGRPYDEYRKMSIPGSVCCPNGELALRIGMLAPDPTTAIIVCCAGRTRSIIGAQTLIDLGVPNPVAALRNGTQGWFLADLPLEHDAERRYPHQRPGGADLRALAMRTDGLMARRGVPRVDAATANAWLADPDRTTYLFDVRTHEEVAADPIPGAVHAPGGQLLQATDQWVGVRFARIVLLDQDGVRAGIVAMWLRRMGHVAHVLDQGAEHLVEVPATREAPLAELPSLEFVDTRGWRVLDLRSSTAYRAGHAPGASWSIRPRVAAAASGAARIAVVSDDPRMAALAAIDLQEAGVREVAIAMNVPTTERTPHDPSDDECIDFVSFAHARHDGDRRAAEQYLRWESSLVDRLGSQERALFAIAPDVSKEGLSAPPMRGPRSAWAG